MPKRSTEPRPVRRDGWPADYDPKKEKRERLVAFGERMLWLERRWRDAGDMTAIERAALECQLHRQPPPSWLTDAIATLVDRRMPDDEKRLRRDFDVHQRRWEAVTELRARRSELAERGDRRGMKWEACWEAVSAELAKSAAAGSAAAVKKSYLLVERAGGEHATLETFKRARAHSSTQILCIIK
jgi:hypothetical protein